MNNKAGILLASIVSLPFSFAVFAQQGGYVDVNADLLNGTDLGGIAERAHENAEDYWEQIPAAARDGDDEELSAGEAVTAIYTGAALNRGQVDPQTLDIVKVTIAVVDAWPDCEDTFDAIRAAVTLVPGMADEIVARVAVKRDCNCANGGIWVDQRLDERIRVEMRNAVLDVPAQCSCSQVAMYGGIAGLPENREFKPDLDDAEKARLKARMIERVTVITERTAALQNRNDWECGCADINLAASMQGIAQDELRDGTYEGLAEKYVEESGDTGLVVDSFGVVGFYPEEHWGEEQYASRDNTLRRKPEVYRGDDQLLDPFHPETEFMAHGDRHFDHINEHSLILDTRPTDLIISEYIEGWNEEALQSPRDERDPGQRNRMIELYNGSDKSIDMGGDRYFVEIYADPGNDESAADAKPRQIIGLNGVIEAGETHVVTFSESDEVLTESADMVTEQLDFRPNETLVIRRLGGERILNCRTQSYSYVTSYPVTPIVRLPSPFSRGAITAADAASPN